MPDNFNEHRADDLDLIQLLRRFVSFIRSSAKLIIGFGILGLLLATALYLISPKQYSSKLILHSFTLTNQEHMQIIASWSELLQNKEYATLASIFNCDQSLIRKLNRIFAEEIVKANPLGTANGFVVNVSVKDTAILAELQEGIKYGLENSEYVKERIAVKRSNLQILIKKVSDEIAKLDSVKANIENALKNNTFSKTPSSFLIDAGDINNQIIALNEKLLNYQEELKFANAVQVIQKFNKLSKPVQPKKMSLLFMGLVTGMAIGYLIYLWKFLRRKVLNYPSGKGN